MFSRQFFRASISIRFFQSGVHTSSEQPIDKVYQPHPELRRSSIVKSHRKYAEIYNRSINDPSIYWRNIAAGFYWKNAPIEWDVTQWMQYNFDVRNGRIFTKWMEGAATNITFNLLDRHVERGLADAVAFYWEGNHPNDASAITYKQLHAQVCKFANVLKSNGVQKGDRISICLPVIPELPVAMLACARIGAIHSVVIPGYSPDALAERITDCQSKILITCDGFWRGSKPLHLKQISDRALERTGVSGHKIQKCIVIAHSKRVLPGDEVKINEFDNVRWSTQRDLWWHEEMVHADWVCEPEWVDAEDPLFLLYTGGTTERTKGVLHTTAGFMVNCAETFRLMFDYRPGDVFWCSADVGCIAGHACSVYGALLNGASSVIFEGTPFFPEKDRFWRIIDKYQINQFYTDPTVIRNLMKSGANPLNAYSLTSLRVLGTFGVPIDPETWLWFYENIGKSRCSIADTYGQTETGGAILGGLPGAISMKPGSVSFPCFGINPILLTDDGILIEGEGKGNLVFDRPWPGMMRTVYNNHDSFESMYFSKFPGYYFTGDAARRDSDGYLWIIGRTNEMLKISEQLISAAKVESVLVEHRSVIEAAVVVAPHPSKGQCLYCFITPNSDISFDQKLVFKLKDLLRCRIGSFAVPDVIQFAPNLPKTPAGKIMREILQKVAQNDRDVGDISALTMELDGIVEELFRSRPPLELNA